MSEISAKFSTRLLIECRMTPKMNAGSILRTIIPGRSSSSVGDYIGALAGENRQ